jgi:hypothetical protein
MTLSQQLQEAVDTVESVLFEALPMFVDMAKERNVHRAARTAVASLWKNGTIFVRDPDSVLRGDHQGGGKDRSKFEKLVRDNVVQFAFDPESYADGQDWAADSAPLRKDAMKIRFKWKAVMGRTGQGWKITLSPDPRVIWSRSGFNNAAAMNAGEYS